MSDWWTAGHAKWPVPLSSTIFGVPVLFWPRGRQQASTNSGVSCGSLSAVGTLAHPSRMRRSPTGLSDIASLGGRTGRLRRTIRNPLRSDRFLHHDRSACHLNASVGNSEQAARTGVCSSPSRLHHPPVRHSVPTASVGTLPPHGKAGVFALNLYKTRSYAGFQMNRMKMVTEDEAPAEPATHFMTNNQPLCKTAREENDAIDIKRVRNMRPIVVFE